MSACGGHGQFEARQYTPAEIAYYQKVTGRKLRPDDMRIVPTDRPTSRTEGPGRRDDGFDNQTSGTVIPPAGTNPPPADSKQPPADGKTPPENKFSEVDKKIKEEALTELESAQYQAKAKEIVQGVDVKVGLTPNDQALMVGADALVRLRIRGVEKTCYLAVEPLEAKGETLTKLTKLKLYETDERLNKTDKEIPTNEKLFAQAFIRDPNTSKEVVVRFDFLHESSPIMVVLLYSTESGKIIDSNLKAEIKSIADAQTLPSEEKPADMPTTVENEDEGKIPPQPPAVDKPAGKDQTSIDDQTTDGGVTTPAPSVTAPANDEPIMDYYERAEADRKAFETQTRVKPHVPPVEEKVETETEKIETTVQDQPTTAFDATKDYSQYPESGTELPDQSGSEQPQQAAASDGVFSSVKNFFSGAYNWIFGSSEEEPQPME